MDRKALQMIIKRALRKAHKLLRPLLHTRKNLKSLKSFINSNQTNSKIVVFTHDSSNTGAPLLSLNIAKSFKEMGYGVIVVSLKEGPLDNDFEGVADEYIKYPSRMFLYRIKKSNINVLLNTIVTGFLAKHLKNNNVVVNLIHEMPTTIIEDLKIPNRKIKDAMLFSDVTVFPSNFHKDYFIQTFGQFKNKVIVRPQGLYTSFDNVVNKSEAKKDVCEIYGIDKGSAIYIGCGHISTTKGFDFFFDLATKYKYDKKVHFIWAGQDNTSYLPTLFREKNVNQLPSNLTVTGFIKDKSLLSKIFLSSDMLLLTSRNDPFPSTVLEAFFLGRPVVAFNKCGGYIDIVNDQTGYLVEPFDTKKMSDIINSINPDSNDYKEKTACCKNLIKEKFAFIDYIQDLASLYTDNKHI